MFATDAAILVLAILQKLQPLIKAFCQVFSFVYYVPANNRMHRESTSLVLRLAAEEEPAG